MKTTYLKININNINNIINYIINNIIFNISITIFINTLTIIFLYLSFVGTKVIEFDEICKFLCIFNLYVKVCRILQFLILYHYYLEYYYYICHEYDL